VTLDELLTAYRVERVRTDLAAQMSESVHMGPCRYCGRHWRRWTGTNLDGHARCVVGDGFKAQLLAVYESDPRLGLVRLAALFECTTSVIRAWIVEADKIRARAA